MAVPITKEIYAMAVKLSQVECILKYPDLHMEKRSKQRAKQFTVSVNQDFVQVVEKCVKVKGENWLCAPLRRSFIEIHRNPHLYGPKLISFEVWEGDNLVAGELGHVIGKIYTSLTGFYERTGTGTIQLCATGQLLHEAGIEIWDFEMSHPYKLAIGAKEIPRETWIQLHKEYRQFPSPDLTQGKSNAQAVLSKVPHKQQGPALQQ
uniref:Leucyl/phenylalanyl-tRNA--protein transferase n=1 Tax=Arcella intermedia TaxID=1963864 RepID=A0A6B2LGP7_9EUKA